MKGPLNAVTIDEIRPTQRNFRTLRRKILKSLRKYELGHILRLKHTE